MSERFHNVIRFSLCAGCFFMLGVLTGCWPALARKAKDMDNQVSIVGVIHGEPEIHGKWQRVNVLMMCVVTGRVK